MNASSRPQRAPALMRLDDLKVRFVTPDADVSAVNGVTLSLQAGRTLCILGESGSGKSVTMRAAMGLLPPHARVEGRIEVAGHDVRAMGRRELEAYRGGDVAMIFQEPMTALDPVFTVGRQVVETIRRHERISARSARARTLELFELVRIPSAAERFNAYPFELSGGLRQRVMIAMAIACRPKLLFADEPTTALDATVQIQILTLLKELQAKLDMAVVFVTHDLGVAAQVADEIAVMYAGYVVERGDVGEVLRHPRHPYTRALMASTVTPEMRGAELTPILGSPPNLDHLPPGCPFAPRCPQSDAVCLSQVPPLSRSPGRTTIRCTVETRAAHSFEHQETPR